MNFVVDAQLQKAESFQISQNVTQENIADSIVAYLVKETREMDSQKKSPQIQNILIYYKYSNDNNTSYHKATLSKI